MTKKTKSKSPKSRTANAMVVASEPIILCDAHDMGDPLRDARTGENSIAHYYKLKLCAVPSRGHLLTLFKDGKRFTFRIEDVRHFANPGPNDSRVELYMRKDLGPIEPVGGVPVEGAGLKLTPEQAAKFAPKAASAS